MQNWIKCSERMPQKPSPDIDWCSIECIVTDGTNVGTCDYEYGHLPTPWSEWSSYGDVSPDKITHWQPLPEPPND